MAAIAILGAGGAVGRNLGHELDRRGLEFRAVGRNAEKLRANFGNRVVYAADLSNPEQARGAVEGARMVIYTVGVDYSCFHMHPVLMRIAVNACIEAAVTQLLVVTSVYSYGRPRTVRVTEDHPREPETRKGNFRREQEDIALDAHRAGQFKVAVVHLPDFYGPYAELSLANPIIESAVSGKRANWLGSLDLPHEFVYVPDAARTILDLATHEGAWGRRWNLAGAGTITGRQFITAAYREAGREPKWRSVSKTVLRVIGLFNPLMRELVEMHYLAETPVILDDSQLRSLLGDIIKTPYAEGIRETMSYIRSRSDSSRSA